MSLLHSAVSLKHKVPSLQAVNLGSRNLGYLS